MLEQVRALTGKPAGVRDGKVRIATFAPIEPKAANGHPLSAEVIGIIEAAVAEAAAAECPRHLTERRPSCPV